MNEGFNEASFAPFVGTARPWDAVIEPVLGGALKAGHLIGKWLHADGSEYRGYKLPSGQLVGSCIVVSATRATALAAEQSAKTASETQIATFRQSLRDLAQLVKDNTATAAQQRQLLVKLARVADGVLADL